MNILSMKWSIKHSMAVCKLKFVAFSWLNWDLSNLMGSLTSALPFRRYTIISIQILVSSQALSESSLTVVATPALHAQRLDFLLTGQHTSR